MKEEISPPIKLPSPIKNEPKSKELSPQKIAPPISYGDVHMLDQLPIWEDFTEDQKEYITEILDEKLML